MQLLYPTSFENTRHFLERFGIKKFKTYQDFGKKINKLKENVAKNINELKKNNKKIVGFGAPAKATTALNFFGISNQIDYIIEDNKLKHNKFIPGVLIPIKDKKTLKEKNALILVLAWNFFQEIKKNNSNLSSKFVNIKELENQFIKLNIVTFKISRTSYKVQMYCSVKGYSIITKSFVKFKIPKSEIIKIVIVIK